MNFPPRYKKDRKPVFFFFLLIVAGILFLGVTSAPLRNVLSQGALFIASPFWQGENVLRTWLISHASFFSSKRSLAEENEALKNRTSVLEAQALNREKIAEENEELKKLLGRTEEHERTILGAILSKPNRSPYDTLILDIGARHGVGEGDFVLALGTIVVGLVEEAYPLVSRVKLFSSPGERIPVILGSDTISAEAEGVGGGNFEIRLPREIGVKEGDSISFPSIKNQIVGVVERIDASPADPFQTIRFKNPVNMFQLQWVEVLVSS